MCKVCFLELKRLVQAVYMTNMVIYNNKIGGAIATIIFDDLLLVSEIRIIDGNRGLFVAMPARRIPCEKFMNVVDATNKDFFKYIETTILDEFNKSD